MNTQYSTYRLSVLTAAIAAGLALVASPVAVAAPTSAVAASSEMRSINAHPMPSGQAVNASNAQEDMTTQKKKKDKKAKQAQTLKAIVVHGGISASQSREIFMKETAPNISDSISAVSIGELPDTTITDSLQRVPGVEISRSAGEGTTLNIRGLPQVGTMLNGEVFLSAANIVSFEPNLVGIPGSLISGVTVVKSPTASLLNNGISGTVDMKTWRPLEMKSGWTFAGSASGSWGSKTEKLQPKIGTLISYNDNNRWGILLSVAGSNLTRANSNGGSSSARIDGENAASAVGTGFGFISAFRGAPIPPEIVQLGGGNVDVNGDGKSNGAFLGSSAFNAEHNTIQRKRWGATLSFQARLGSGFRLTSDLFYTHMDAPENEVRAAFNSLASHGATYVPLESRNTGVSVTGPYNNDQGWNQKLYTTQTYKKWIADMEAYSIGKMTRSVSRNFNLQLNYDNGGPFTGDIRWVSGKAQQAHTESYFQFTNSNGAAWPNRPSGVVPPTVYFVPGGTRVFNSAGIAPNVVPVTFDLSGKHMRVGLPDQLQSFLKDKNNWVPKTSSSENNYRRHSNLNVVRADGHFAFNDTSNLVLDFGLHNSIRTASNVDYDLVAPAYAGKGASLPGGCLRRWKGADVVMTGGGVDGACSAGNSMGFFRAQTFVGLHVNQLPGILRNHMRKYTNIAGTGVTMYALDPSVMDDAYAFQNTLYPGEIAQMDPGASWAVFLKETTGYIQLDFNNQDAALPFSGNVGLRVVRTNLHVTQNLPGKSRPYGQLAESNGQIYTDRTYYDYLPAANLAFDFTPSLKLRLAYSKNMLPLNLDQWGGGLSLTYGFTGKGYREVEAGSSSGSPSLNPWRSQNFGASLEYYGQYTFAALAAFDMKIKSFLENGTFKRCDIPDLDGEVRRCVVITGPVQGAGTSLHGFEAQVKQNFRFLNGFLSHTGIDANFTYAPSDTGSDLAGNTIPFQQTSKYQANLALWYQTNRFQFRVAGNYRSKKAVGSDAGGVIGLEEYQKPTFYVDASVSYKVSPQVQVFLQGSNLTGEDQRFYWTWTDQVVNTSYFERRFFAGVRVKF